MHPEERGRCTASCVPSSRRATATRRRTGSPILYGGSVKPDNAAALLAILGATLAVVTRTALRGGTATGLQLEDQS